MVTAGASPMRPLTGTTVLDLSRFVAGSYLTMALAALGADVVKVEVPPIGDPYRQQGTVDVAGQSALFLGLNSGKRSLALDLRHPDARAVLDRLVDRADFLVQNARPGSLDRHGLGWDAVHARNPRCIYASVSGYGPVGPASTRGGFDLVLQAESGLMALTGEPDGPPVAIGAPLLDIGSALACLNALLVAHLVRIGTGTGTDVSSSLLEFGLAGQTTLATNYLAGGPAPVRSGAHSSLFAPYGSFRCADDTWIVLAGAGSEHLWVALCATIGRPELVDDVRFATNADRVAHRPDLVATIEDALRSVPARVWVERLSRAGVPAGLLTTLPDLLVDGQVEALGSVTEIDGDDPYRQVAFPFRLAGEPTRPAGPAPRLGQHTHAVLVDLGFEEADIEGLVAAGAVMVEEPLTTSGGRT